MDTPTPTVIAIRRSTQSVDEQEQNSSLLLAYKTILLLFPVRDRERTNGYCYL